MNGKIKVLFILPQRKYISGDVPLGLCSLSAYLKQQFKDIEIILLDGNVLGQDTRALRRKLGKQHFDAAGIFVDTLSFSAAVEMISLAREISNVVMVGGPHPTALPESFFELKELDVIIPGEAEYKLKILIEALRDCGRIPEIPGAFIRRDGVFSFNGDAVREVNLEELPFPDRSIIDSQFYFKRLNYFDLLRVPVTATTMMASRGCFFKCTYCQPFLDKHFGHGIRYRSPENVLRELRHLNKEYKINAVFFHDDNLTADRKWVFTFCRLLSESGLNIIWGCNSRVDNFTFEAASAMAKSGLKKVHFGIESGSQRVLDEVYKKGITLSKVRDALTVARNHNIATLGFFMLGAPTETLAEMTATIRLARELDLDEATFSIFTPIPGAYLWSQLEDKLKEQGINFDELNYYSNAAIDLGGGISCRQIRRKQLSAFLNFYTSPKRLRYMASHFKSPAGLSKLGVKMARVLGM